MLRTLGADLVGMSTVPEVVAARELGLEVLALSVVASVEPLEYGAPGVDADEVVRIASASATRLGRVLATVLLRAGQQHGHQHDDHHRQQHRQQHRHEHDQALAQPEEAHDDD
jgi:hypothetical protein